MNQPNLLDWKPNPTARFNGATYDAASDDRRLRGQIKRVHDACISGRWLTLGEIETLTGDPQASISAQLRHLRKVRFGGFLVEKRNRGDREHGLYEYRLLPPASEAA